MEGFPAVSAMCLTYGRPHLLEEAIESFLRQDYPGPKELVVLNDFSRQTLSFNHPEVRIVNVGCRFPTVGEKRNACAALCRNELLFVWDDDDLYLPWRLSLSVQRLDPARGFYKPVHAWALNNGALSGPTSNLFHSGSCFARGLFHRVGGYPHIGSGQDWELEVAFGKLIGPGKDDHSLSPERLYYIYRWSGTSSFHLSAFGRDREGKTSGNDRVARYVRRQVCEGRIQTGMISLRPQWKDDYLALVKRHLAGADIGQASQSPTSPPRSDSPKKVPSPPHKALTPSKPVGPLVSCVMPTYGRPDYVAESIAMFLAQDYPHKELIVLNDCPGQILDGKFPGVKIFNVDKRWRTLGAKRNAAIELASGDLIAVWDDDDVYFPWRLSQGVRRIQELQAGLYCPAQYWAYWGSEDLHDNRANLNWIYHPLLMFWRECWEAVGGYPARTHAEDTVFVKKMLQHLGTDWRQDDVARHERPMILRGRSKYVHTSIPGGQQKPDVTPRRIVLSPSPIQDPVLRGAADRLIELRTSGMAQKLHPPARVPERTALLAPGEVRLDELEPILIHVGYGQLGRGGDLGYEGKSVKVAGTEPAHSLSTHPPGRLKYRLDSRFDEFRCRVAINDDAPADVTAADFQVLADGRIVAMASNVGPRQSPRVLTANIRGAAELELVVRARRWENCHTVWLDPILTPPRDTACDSIIDPLRRAEIEVPHDLEPVDLCMATVGTHGFESWIDDLFGAILANGQCPHAQFAIFSIGDEPSIRRVAEKYQAITIPCQPLGPVDCSIKAVLYSAGRAIPAAKFLCFDADMLVLDDLRPIVAGIDAVATGSILACREANGGSCVEQAIHQVYRGEPADLARLLGSRKTSAGADRLVVNDGFFAGSRVAMRGLEDSIASLCRPAEWVDEFERAAPWRNQFIFNLALAQSGCGVELSGRYNVQLHSQSVDWTVAPGGPQAQWNGERAAIVHFNGHGRGKYPTQRGRYRKVDSPLPRNRPTSGYDDFASALRRWIGLYGTQAMAWSYYGTADGRSARLSHVQDFPLLATLHYLIRSNGCCRVLESGTARGVAAACLASAVSSRSDAAVVTLDVKRFKERDDLWAMLPDQQRRSIDARHSDSIEGMQAALKAGERFHAALLDSVHTAEHVLQEFHLAKELVCPGGLILIHDAILKEGTVAEALTRIESQGYGVARLWTADEGGPADDGLGLAVIENRNRKLA